MKRMSRERFLSDAELARFMEAVRTRRHVNQPRDHCLFAILANTGIRPSEALALTRADVHPHARPPWMRVKRLKKKREQFDEMAIPKGLAATIAAYVDGRQDGPLFPIVKRSAQRLFKLYARKAGIVGRPLYILRHTAATRIYRATRDIELVQSMLGHESSSTSSIYAHVPGEVLAEWAGALPVFV